MSDPESPKPPGEMPRKPAPDATSETMTLREMMESVFFDALKIADPVLKRKLLNVQAPRGLRPFSKITAGLHEIGFERENAQGDPVVGVPGYCHGNWSFIDQIGAFAQRDKEIRALSFMGDAESPAAAKPKEDLLVQDYVEAMENYLDTLGRPAVLLCHSLGGLFGMIAATRDPRMRRIKGLILINSVPPSNMRYRSEAHPNKGVFKVSEHPEFKEALFSRMKEKEMHWYESRLDQMEGSTKIRDDYGMHRHGGHVDPRLVKCPVLELEGSEDLNSIGLLNRDRRGVVDLVDKDMNIVDFFKQQGGLEKGRCVVVDRGCHNMLLGSQARLTSEQIFAHYDELFA